MIKINPLKDLFYTFSGVLEYEIWIKKFCYNKKKSITEFQFNKLKKLLVDSYENTIYYKELFNCINFNPYFDFHNLEDLKKIPILSKDTFKIQSNQFTNKKYLKNSLLFKTSGSSGSPMSILVHTDQWIIEQGVIWRHWKWGGYNFRDRLAIVRSYVPKSPEQLWKRNWLTNFTYYSPFHLNDVNIKSYLKNMVDTNIKILRGYPSSILFLAQYVLKANCEVPKLKMILTASEVLTDEDRCIIEDAFKTKIFNHYGLAEQIVMMGDCEKHEGLHNYDEYGYLELIDTDNPKIKRIIGTNLHNLTTPLIRYDTGDLAIISDKPCSCGRSSIIIKNIIGRHDSYIVSSNGFKIPTINFYTMFEEFSEIEKWQIIQHSIIDLEFIIKSHKFSSERKEYLLDQIKSRVNESFNIVINVNKDFLKKGEGKINSFVSLLNKEVKL